MQNAATTTPWWIPLIVAAASLIGTLIGGLIAGGAAWLNSRSQHRYQVERDRKALFRNKLQELYEVVSQFKNSYSQKMQSELIQLAFPSAAGHRPEQELVVPVERLQMLVDFYAPELADQVAVLMKYREQFGEVLIDSIRYRAVQTAVTKATELEPLREALIVNTKSISDTCELLQKQIVLLSKQYL